MEYLIDKPTFEEFCKAYNVIMRYIDTEPNSRPLFHALLNFKLYKIGEIDED